jgi:hypothetical protein
MINKLLILLLLCYNARSQPVIHRTFGTNTVVDPRFMASLNLLVPRYTDTMQANGSIGIDTCGAIIFTYSTNALWLRECSPKRWARMIKSGQEGINQLTGDISGGPSTGSVVTTLATTGVSAGTYNFATITVDAKGRVTAASTATPISGLTAGRVTLSASSTTLTDDAGFTYNSTTNLGIIDSLQLKNRSGGNTNVNRLIANMQQGQDSLTFAVGVIRGFPVGGAGTAVNWDFIIPQHGKLGFDSVKPKVGGILRFYHARSNPMYVSMMGDEAIVSKVAFTGGSAGLDSTDIYVTRPINNAILLRGNATTWVVQSGNVTGWSISYNSGTGLISITAPTATPFRAADTENLVSNYVGANNYRIERVFSGIGAATIGLRLRDIATNNIVTGAPTTSDNIQINGFPWTAPLNVMTVDTDLFNTTHYITASSNFWVLAMFKR